jgi:hypothetical protein
VVGAEQRQEGERGQAGPGAQRARHADAPTRRSARMRIPKRIVSSSA